MNHNPTNLHPRREFLKLATLTGAAALTGNAPAAAAEPTASLAAAEQTPDPHSPERGAANKHAGNDKMEFLRVSGSHIVDAGGKKIRLRGTCPGGWMNMEDFINGHPGA
jgi:hypothetical protein